MKKVIIFFTLCLMATININAQEKALYTYKVGKVKNTPNVFNIGYSRTFDKQNDLWLSIYGVECSFFFNMTEHKTDGERLAPYGPCVWYNFKKKEFRGVRLGYQFLSYLSCGVLMSWKTDEFDYRNGYCSFHHENHEWIKGHSSRAEKFGFGAYVKATLPLRYVSPFVYGQVATNGNNTAGIGLSINLGGKGYRW